MIRLAVTGAAGRMGSRIAALSAEYEGLKLSGALERSGAPAVGKDIGMIAGLGETGVLIKDSAQDVISSADVTIDFSSVAATLGHIEIAAANSRAMVIGTTGFEKDDLSKIKKAAEKIPVMMAPNMSVGVNLLLKVLAQISPVLADEYDIEIVEAHHRLKKDAPSGTALKMAQVIADSIKRDLDEVAVYCRKGITGERTRKEIGIQTVRAGDIVGDHTVMFGGLGERIEITHKASSRDTFARGALRAALWIVGKKPGLYDMQDVLGLK
ncbi:MAG: 4-hydroxy-tetrahydrodipicolinate reductase [Nitrospiraceae bacterium]|nr:4-hydroxy-tetrahydrodipicolinate reductase [Nitrospiraceae bacterium]